jgi:hypothetical protein
MIADNVAKEASMSNHVMEISPYWLEEAATWVFDDAGTGLHQEPFVSGTGEMIDDLVKDIPNARGGFRLLFSALPFPGYQKRLTWKAEETGGNRYVSGDSPAGGWLSSALLRYFGRAPALLYVKAEPKANA